MSPFSFVRSKFGGPRKNEEQDGADEGAELSGSDGKRPEPDDLTAAMDGDDWLTRDRRPEEAGDDDFETMSWSDVSDSDDADVERFRKSLTIGDSLEDVDWDALGDKTPRAGVQSRRRQRSRDPNAPAFSSDDSDSLGDLGDDPSEAIRALADRALAGRVRDEEETVHRGAPPRGARSRRRMRPAQTEPVTELDAEPESFSALDAPIQRMEPPPELLLDADPDALDALWASESAALLAQSSGSPAPSETLGALDDSFGPPLGGDAQPEPELRSAGQEVVEGPQAAGDDLAGEVSEEDVRAAIAAWTSGVNQRAGTPLNAPPPDMEASEAEASEAEPSEAEDQGPDLTISTLQEPQFEEFEQGQGGSDRSEEIEVKQDSLEVLEPDELDLHAADRFKAALDHQADLENAIIDGPSMALPAPLSESDVAEPAKARPAAATVKRTDVDDAEELIDEPERESEWADGAALASTLAQSWRGVVESLDRDAPAPEADHVDEGLPGPLAVAADLEEKREQRWLDAAGDRSGDGADIAPIARSVTTEAIERVAAAASGAATSTAAETPQSPILQQDDVEEAAADSELEAAREVQQPPPSDERPQPESPRRSPRRLAFGLVNAAVKARRTEAVAPQEDAADADTEEGDRVRRRARIGRSAAEREQAPPAQEEADPLSKQTGDASEADAAPEESPKEAAPREAPPRRGRLGLSPIADRLIGMRAAVSSWSDDAERKGDAQASADQTQDAAEAAEAQGESAEAADLPEVPAAAESPLAARRRLFSGAVSSPVEAGAAEASSGQSEPVTPVETAAAKAAEEARSLLRPEADAPEAASDGPEGADMAETGDETTAAAPGLAEVVSAKAPEDGAGVDEALTEEADANTMPIEEQARMVEAMLFASEKPMSTAELGARMPVGCDPAVAVRRLEEMYAPRGVRVVRVAGKWAFRTAPEFAYLMATESVESRKLSKAAIETLAIVAYHQPVTRTEIEEIRQVSVSKGTLDLLMELEWIKLGRRRQTPGRPVTFITTERFLDHFGLESTKDLPGLDELRQAGLLDNRPKLGAPLLGEDGAAEEDEEYEDDEAEDERDDRQEALM